MLPLITGYTIGQELYASHNSRVYRARRQQDGAPVILKTLSDAHPSPERLAWFRRESDLTRSLAAVPGVIQVLGLEQHPTGWVLVLADTGGDSLANLGLAGRLDLPTCLRLALDLTRILGAVHQEQVIHKDLNPNNIVYHPATHQLTLIDFGLATRLSRETPTFRSATVLEGTLPYLAPEQTGRMNRAVDYRSDFYSLGITLYELLTGQVPFTSDDPLELVHSHIARPPVPPHTVQPTIPAALSAIILKLLAKDADDRYQSAYGLQADWQHCLQQLETTGTIAPFPIGQQDISDRFALPQQLYGRAQERTTLLAAFDQVAAGARALLLVAGAPGIGKTALVQEVYRPLTARRGLFGAGKFDQVQRATPYLAVVQACEGLLRQLLTESDAVLAQWRVRLTAALGVNGQVLVAVLPLLERIIGAHPPVPELGPQETQNRFARAFEQFVGAFARPEHPLVLFLDDLQWADSGSLTLLEQVLSGGVAGHLLVIGAYRDGEVSPGHPLGSTLATIAQGGMAPQTLTLGPLAEGAVTELVQDTLHVDVATAQPLATLVHHKTGGNPFFVGVFLKALYIEALLTFDHQQGRWRWELAQIEARQMTDNVVALMTQQVERLPTATQQVLQRAACIGNRFDLAMVAVVGEASPATTATLLEPALLAGLIEPLGEGYKLVTIEIGGLAQAVQAEYRFAHDRIQQAAYEQVPGAARAAHHWQIGQHLLAQTPLAEREARVFDLVGQLNVGRALATEAERLDLAQLNLVAGRKAKESAAFTAAYDYFMVSVELLPTDAWEAHYALALALHEDAAEAAYLSGDYAGMERLIAVILTRAHTVLDTMKAYEARRHALMAQARPLDGIQTGREALAKLAVHLPETPDRTAIMQAIQAPLALLGDRPVESLFDLPPMTDPTNLAALYILSNIFSSCYVAAPQLAPIVASRTVALSLQAGNAIGSCVGYSIYGVILCGAVGNIETGYRFGQLAVRLVEQMRARSVQAIVAYAFHGLIRIWREPVRASLPHLLDNYHIGLETGDFDFAGYSLNYYALCSFCSGNELQHLAQEIETYHQAMLHLNQPLIADWFVMLWQGVLNLIDASEQPHILSGRACNEEALLALSQSSNDRKRNLLYMFCYKLILAYLFDQRASLGELATTAEQQSALNRGHALVAQAYFYATLARLRLYPDAPAEEQRVLQEKVGTIQQQIETWAQHAPMNFQHKWHLVEAERCRVLGEPGSAWGHYQQAIAGAHEHGYLHEAALAHELLGRFLVAQGLHDEAALALRRAHTTYGMWGATAKVQQLEAQDADLLRRVTPTPAAPVNPTTTTGRPGSGSTSSNTTTTSALDVASIVKASQALSGEVQLAALLTRLLHVLLENAGADRGVLLLHRAGDWVVEAEGRVAEAASVLARTPLAQAALPQSLISYVLRTQEPVVLHDAPADQRFTADPYLQAQQPRSVLALPLLQQNALTGLLYLEHTQTSGAFTPQRQEVLALLSGQVAISLENARLYTEMEDLVTERTAQLSTALTDAEAARAVAEEANALKTRFVANMSHELRTPLNAIINFTYILKSGLKGAVTAEQVPYFDRIYASGEHLLGLINDILDLAKIEAGRMDLYREEVALGALVESTLSTAVGLTKDKPIELHHEIAEGLPPIAADKTRLRQVLLNLLSNAAKFTDQGSITVRVWQAGGELMTSVSDTGVGIPAAKLETIFEEFRQAEEGSARSYQGTGLGLPICQRLVELHGGRLWVESTVGGGSTFTFSLPLPVAPTSDASDASDATLSLSLAGIE